jgi:hypothetical protein
MVRSMRRFHMPVFTPSRPLPRFWRVKNRWIVPITNVRRYQKSLPWQLRIMYED